MAEVCKMDVLGDFWTVCRAPSDQPCMCDVVVQALETCQINKGHTGPCIFYRPVAADFNTAHWCGKPVEVNHVNQTKR